MRNLKKLAITAVLATSFSLPASSAVFVVAHPDDHILLMGPNLITDIKGGYPTVVVIVTAGDAGNGHSDKPAYTSGQYNDFGNQYYRVRLQAHMLALEKWIPGASPAAGDRPWAQTTENFGTLNPRVEKWTLGNVVLYHLNLPDAGFPNSSETYLQRLLNVAGTEVSDVTGTNRYTLASLKSTIQQIISRNNRNAPNVVINRANGEYNSVHADHVDHTAVGKIVDQAISVEPYTCLSQAIYKGYQIQDWKMDRPELEYTQRIGYELLHTILAQRGNVVPFYDGDYVKNPSWMQTTFVPGTTNRQYGAMDGFHTSFYGRSYHQGHRIAIKNCAF